MPQHFGSNPYSSPSIFSILTVPLNFGSILQCICYVLDPVFYMYTVSGFTSFLRLPFNNFSTLRTQNHLEEEEEFFATDPAQHCFIPVRPASHPSLLAHPFLLFPLPPVITGCKCLLLLPLYHHEPLGALPAFPQPRETSRKQLG
jgi:hypothetical protein